MVSGGGRFCFGPEFTRGVDIRRGRGSLRYLRRRREVEGKDRGIGRVVEVVNTTRGEGSFRTELGRVIDRVDVSFLVRA